MGRTPSPTHALVCAALLATLSYTQDAYAQSCSTGGACYEAGQALLVEGEFGKAIIQFNKGYNIDRNGAFLVNIALCYAGLEKYDRAISYARDAQTHELPPQLSVYNSAKLASYLVIDSSLSSSEDVARAVALAKNIVEDPGDTKGPGDGKTSDSGGLGVLGFTGIGVGVVGLGLLGGSAYVGSVYQEQLDRVKARDPTQSREEAEETRQTGLLLVGVGTGATILGVGLVAFDLLTGAGDSDAKKKEAASAIPVLTAGPDGAYAGFRMTF